MRGSGDVTETVRPQGGEYLRPHHPASQGRRPRALGAPTPGLAVLPSRAGGEPAQAAGSLGRGCAVPARRCSLPCTPRGHGRIAHGLGGRRAPTEECVCWEGEAGLHFSPGSGRRR